MIAAGFLTWELYPRGVPMYDYTVVATHPHDELAYSQGLVFADSTLYESTGRYGTSSVREVELTTGRVLERHDLPDTLFGEGLALHGGRLVQLTWQSGVARVYDQASLALVDQHTYEGQGWGLTSDGTHLIRSDGTDRLSFHDPETFEEVRRIRVRAAGEPLHYINELEYVDGEIFANVWKSDYIARIDPDSGEVKGYVDLTGIFDYGALPDPEAVLNGVAYNVDTGHLLVTGKLWPVLFEIEIARR